jgi:3-deoxy-manno-octulosonate cytidylyltransferase (CMP-KDO synthetase)
MAKIQNIKEFEDQNEVKVVVDNNNNAIYFSREPIPSRKKGVDEVPMFKQVCIIPFRRQALIDFNNTPETELEKIESVDMLRIIESGESIHMVKTDEETYSVDTEEDRIKVETLMKKDSLSKEYQ